MKIAKKASNAAALTEADKAHGNAALAGLKPKKFATNGDASRYLTSVKPKLTADQRGAVDRYTGDGFFDLNKKMRAGDLNDPEIKRLDSAMRPLPDDLVLTRQVDPQAFGLDLSNLDKVEGLVGHKISDKAYASTSLGSPYGGGLGGVTMRIVAPKGTPAIPAAAFSRNPSEREVLLDRGLEMAVAKVVKNSRGGYDMTVIVLPKGSS
jgi:hypothetical protein